MTLGHNRPPLDEGWIARHRSVRGHWLVGHGLRVKPADPKRKHCLSQGEAWEDLLMECRYEDGFVENGGKKMRLDRGSLVGAVSWLGMRWNWTPQTVRTFLDKLECDGMISRHVPGASENNKHVGKQATIISVCNYDRFQSPNWGEEQTEQQTNNNSPKNEPQTSSKQPTNDQQTSNNIYKDNKGTKEQRNKETKKETTLPARTREAVDIEIIEPVKSTSGAQLVMGDLLDACNGSLDNPVNCQGLLSEAIPRMWVESGCDIERDIIPTLKALGRKHHGKRIRSWAYFTDAIADARDTRLRGMPPPDASGGRSQSKSETEYERITRLMGRKETT